MRRKRKEGQGSEGMKDSVCVKERGRECVVFYELEVVRNTK